jgi:hypothetical protein
MLNFIMLSVFRLNAVAPSWNILDHSLSGYAYGALWYNERRLCHRNSIEQVDNGELQAQRSKIR